LLNITAFAALIRRKRGEAELTQETLALDVFGDSARNVDISRLENALTPNPQEATVQKLCTALNISAAEMEPIRQSRVSAAQLDQIPTLSREELENIATRFQIDDVFDRKDADLRQLLTHKATGYRALKSQVDAIPDSMKRLSNLKAAAQDAIARVDLDEVENLMTLVHATELEEAAKSAEIRADTALLRGNVDHAFTLLSTTADSFAQVDPLEPARRRILTYCATLYNHGVRYSGTGLNAAEKLVATQLTPDLETDDPLLWAAGQNARAVMLQTQGTRTDGEKGADLLAEPVSAYRAALEVRTRADNPVDWAMTQNNIAIAQLTIAAHATYSDPSSALDEALTAVDKSLTVFDPVHMPYYHGTATRLRAQIDALS
jgi:transcriptional regulator with XRE-family HTH domain